MTKGYRECKRVLEKIYKRKFSRRTPSFLKNTELGDLHIELFNPEIGTGVMCVSKTHLEYNPKIHKTYSEFRLQQKKNELRKQICLEKGYVLVTIPYIYNKEEIEHQIRKREIVQTRKLLEAFKTGAEIGGWL